MVTFVVLALSVTGRALCDDARLRLHEELFLDPSILAKVYGRVEIAARASAVAAAPVNVSGYVVAAVPAWQATGVVDTLRIVQEPVAQQRRAVHTFRLVNRTRVHAVVRTQRVAGSGAGNLSAAFFYLDDANYDLYRRGRPYTPMPTVADPHPHANAMPSEFRAGMVATAHSALYHAVLENNDYVDMTADWNVTVTRTAFNISSAAVRAECTVVVGGNGSSSGGSSGDRARSCVLDLRNSSDNDYYLLVSTTSVRGSSYTDASQVVVSVRGIFQSVWRFGAFGVLAMLSGILFAVTCVAAFCCRRTPAGPLVGSADDSDTLAAVPMLRGTAPTIVMLQPSPPPSPSL